MKSKLIAMDSQNHPQPQMQGQPEGGTPAAANDAPCAKSAGRPRARDVEARMQSLIDTAACLFLEKGYSKVSLEMIAREAHVAVRTIYVKFGGKAGLLSAVLAAGRSRFFSITEMETDKRSIPEIIDDFADRFLAMITAPTALSMQRMVIAESKSNPELAQTFFATGPLETRAMLERFFARPDIAAQLHGDVDVEQLPVYLLNCIMGDQLRRFLLDDQAGAAGDDASALKRRLALFYRSALRQP
jgi:TetR/AcrR family transcriptional regulator, mexJK operon transcriptional repressor